MCKIIHSLVILHPSRTICFRSCSMLLFFVLRAGPSSHCQRGGLAMPRSILHFSIWNSISYLDNMCKQPESRPSFILSKASYGRFCIFSNRYIGHIWRKQIEKKQKLKRQAFRLLVGAWSTSCPKITPKYVQLSGAWPIHFSGSDWTAQLVERKTTALSSF